MGEFLISALSVITSFARRVGRRRFLLFAISVRHICFFLSSPVKMSHNAAGSFNHVMLISIEVSLKDQLFRIHFLDVCVCVCVCWRGGRMAAVLLSAG